jgi:uncharacterized protein YjiK
MMISIINWLVFFSIQSGLVVVDSHKTQIAEPSDICLGRSQGEYMVAGSKYKIAAFDEKGTLIGEFDTPCADLEAICTDGNFYYGSEESFQMIYVFNKSDFSVVKTVPLNHHGGRNEGVEAFTWFAAANCFVAITEENPCKFMLLNKDFSAKEEFTVPGISEASSVTVKNSNLYVLSEKNHAIYHLDMAKKSIQEEWDLPVLGAEGLVFKDNGNVLVVSDAMARIYELELKK